ncbi:MAG: hypothetical protein WHU94_00605 [Thermogemmata sp.]|jgi:hypothetical protein|uniref:Uncharacterized protein n=1 Tax=Thermogemmata fonticola TaxID=2755323 RepID=A0A7V9ACZ1_9BACT|nr:hypothetical protein [Thermogemmata fonticola]MBA2227272.1 hypothetical protein [Thermogemmata fonticola]MCX8138662.1 hypothetical protein [Gemmataceae bacterium]GIW84153.1 MAG: hypothetical protein KatS3mg106_666 [Gemmataceae bacterium]
MDAPEPIPAEELNRLSADPAVLEALLLALRAALSQEGEQRLFRSGKLPGLFAQRVGPAATAAALALRHGLLQITRRETRGKILTEWVRATPAAVQFVHQHDSPQAILREWKQTVDLTRAGLPAWMVQFRQELAALAERFEAQANALRERLQHLSQRLEAALRRCELDRTLLGEPVRQLIPWAADALDYLDQRAAATPAPCLLPELFAALATRHPALGIPAFHQGLIQLDELRLLRLLPHEPVEAPEFALVHRGQLLYAAQR